MRKIMLVVMAFLMFPLSAFAAGPQGSPSAVTLNMEDAKRFGADFFKQQEIQEQLAGAVLVIVKDGKILLNQGYGYANVAAKQPVDAEKTLFRLASVSKLFTAAGVMQLSESGKVDLDTDVQRYLPGLHINNTSGLPLTLKHLMTHTTGFDNGDVLESGTPSTLEKFVKEKMPTIVRKPGEVYRYDNFGFTLQGYIIQQVSRMPFENYMAEKLFKPLGMSNTSFIFDDKVIKRMATPYDNQLQPTEQIPNDPVSAPEGGMTSTGKDMAQFMLAMLNSGKKGENRILQPESIQAMEHSSVAIHPKVPGNGYAFESTYSQDYNGYKVAEKGGDLSGFHSNLWLLPEQNTGIFLALNSDKGNLRQPLFHQFMSRYFPKASKAPASIEPAATQEQLQRFAGLYRHLRTPALTSEITAIDGALLVKDVFGEHKLRQNEELLFYDEEDKPAGFKLDADGKVLYFYYNQPDSWLEKLPEPQHFSDVGSDHPYAKYIYNLVQLGAIPESTGSFQPDRPVTRGQFIAQLIPLAGFQSSTRPSAFKDTKGSPYETAIQTALDYGVVQGLPGSYFGPDLPLTREQAATFVWRIAHIGLGAAPVKAAVQKPFSDWAAEGVQYVVGRGLYGPDAELSDGKVNYRAQDPMLNQEAAALIYRLLQNLL
ncbi:hypothetical protein H70357_25640 [Paenibacillus sp. FSL H7-0357]|uniref:serine hydrolase n=1 Tax=Paenibacillus sp. FSL H7-0357 TaxID=1536774 RepID=UPI0004F89260|nr:serine hydrolase [Paenibacillus sp. FSL H7-0357]AIQ19719.1 hypothetical protein H70357_25640 [Paenibacillus sp. FSL H7-0357]